MILRAWVLCTIALLLHCCAPKTSDIVVLEIGQSKVSLAEYENFFSRNSGGWEFASKSTPEEKERFLNLLTNYKLKLIDAYERNLIEDPEVQQELKEYRSSLAASYLTEKEVTEPGIRLLYDRKKEEIRASHILIAVKHDATPEETLRAWNKAVEIIKRAKGGEPFDSLAILYSDDPSAKNNHGDLYYFSSGHMQKAFEDAAYALKKGEISPIPLRTSFGYHVIKVTDRQPTRNLIRVRHIMTRFMVSPADSADTAQALQRIQAIYDSLQKGWNFERLAREFSEDAGSQSKGGDLGWFERRSFIQPFEEAAFKLRPGEVSGIVRTQYGYHILRCDSVKPIPKFEEIKEDLKKQYQQFRFNDDYAAYINGLKKKFFYTLYNETFDAFLAAIDTNKTTEDSTWWSPVSNDLRQQVLFSVNNRPYTLDVFIQAFGSSSRMDFRGIRLRRSELMASLDKFVEGVVFDEQSIGIEKRYPEFTLLMKEYQDGVVLFKAEQMEVWNKVNISDSALRVYFEQNRSKFMWPELVSFKEIRVESDTFAFMLYDSLLLGADFEYLASRYNYDEELRREGGDRGFLEVTEDELAEVASKMEVGEFSPPIENENVYSLIKVTAKEPAREKTFEEAGTEVSNAYQEYETKRLTEEWLNNIKKRHSVVQYKDRLQRAFTTSQTSN